MAPGADSPKQIVYRRHTRASRPSGTLDRLLVARARNQPPVNVRRLSFIVVVLAALTLSAGAGPAFAAKSCGKQVIDDWYDNGRVDRIYELQCYRDAIKQLPVDVKTYSSAKEDIERALAFARQGKQDTSSSPPQPSPPSAPTTTPDTPVDTSEREAPAPSPGDDTETDTTGGAAVDPGEGDGGSSASAPLDSSSDSLPLPLLVLGGLALLLLAAGSAGYLTRRLQARRAGVTVPPSGE